MGYGSWGRPKRLEGRDFYEKAYQRKDLAEWDARWEALSAQARDLFLNVVKGPSKQRVVYSQAPSVSTDKFPPQVLKELTDGEFVQVHPAKSRSFRDRVVACDALYDFAARVRTLRKLHLLAADQPSQFAYYVDYAFIGPKLTTVLTGVLRNAEVNAYVPLDQALSRFVTNRRWPGWVAKALNDPLAERIVEVLRKAEGPIPLAELAGRLEGSKPDEVRSSLEELIRRLAVVEDLKPETWELMVGFLPSVREEMIEASKPRTRPPLVVVEHPKEVGPHGSLIVNDLRAVLLEVVSEPPRVRQDHSVFQKELERFQAPLDPLPHWLLQALRWSSDRRVSQALGWAHALRLVQEHVEDNRVHLQLTPKGSAWVSSGIDEQYASIYGLLNAQGMRNDQSMDLSWHVPGLDPYGYLGSCDTRFLGEPATVQKVVKGKPQPYHWDTRPDDVAALRKSVDKALATLKPGVFYQLESVEAHLAYGEHNPLHRGLDPSEVVIYWANRLVPPLEEQREEVARVLLDGFVRRRLLPLGCVRAAIDENGQLAIAREPAYDAYFGRKVSVSELSPAASAATKVVIQPDFSVVVIGLNSTPAAELAPFCERTSRGGGQGAILLKITRESVVKAVSQGLEPAEVLARLQRHASNAVPANVLREVRDWSNWVRQVSLSSMTVLRCPDRDTADRVMGALKRQGERLTDTLVAIDQKSMTPADRAKLRAQGIIVQAHTGAPAKKGKRRW